MNSLKVQISQKQKFSQVLRNRLPILQADLESLSEVLNEFKKTNPFLEIKDAKEINKSKKHFFNELHNTRSNELIESFTIDQKSLHENLNEQINPPLFPTQKSQKIAYLIIEYINNEGYFEFDEAILNEGFSFDEIERIRKRFCHLEPVGVGAKDYKEAFLFQLEHVELDDKIYQKASQMIEDFENIQTYAKDENFSDILELIKHFRTPPAIEFMQDSAQIVPDFFIFCEDGGLKVQLNDDFYPQILLDIDGQNEKDEYIANKIKEAKELLDALQMRRSTLYKIGLNIIENQYDFFFGGNLKPMTLKELAAFMQRNPSTISRAIARKYLSCDRGVIALKDFFTTAIDEETSNAALKEFISETIAYENRLKPLSDAKLLKMIENRFNITLSRRTITKYRKQLNIASSSERKKLYTLQ